MVNKPNHFRLYQAWASLYAHFSNEQYDAVKYNFKANVKYGNLENRVDYKLFKQAESEFGDLLDFISVFLSLIEDGRGKTIPHISDMIEEKHQNNVVGKWKVRIKSLEYHLQSELSEVIIDNPSFKEYWLRGSTPKAFKDWIGKKISTETVVMIDGAIPIISHWEKYLPAIMADTHLFFIKKYARFINHDPERTKAILKKVY